MIDRLEHDQDRSRCSCSIALIAALAASQAGAEDYAHFLANEVNAGHITQDMLQEERETIYRLKHPRGPIEAGGNWLAHKLGGSPPSDEPSYEGFCGAMFLLDPAMEKDAQEHGLQGSIAESAKALEAGDAESFGDGD